MAKFLGFFSRDKGDSSPQTDEQATPQVEDEQAYPENVEENAVESSNESSSTEPLCAEVQQSPLPTEPDSAPQIATQDEIDSNQASWSSTLAELKDQMDKLLTEFNGKLKYDSKKQEQIDQLYKENVEFREGLVEQFKRKLTLAVIEQIDDAEKQIAHFEKVEYSENNFRKILHSFEDISLCFRDMLLERFDIESWQSEPETPFDPRRQRTLRTTPTGKKELTKKIKRSIRYGYQTASGVILRPEMVDVYVFDESLVQSETTAVEQDLPEPVEKPKDNVTSPTDTNNE